MDPVTLNPVVQSVQAAMRAVHEAALHARLTETLIAGKVEAPAMARVVHEARHADRLEIAGVIRLHACEAEHHASATRVASGTRLDTVV
jgi:hypothetical protein